MNKKVKGVLIILLSTLCLTGCWDKVEIEERAYITTLALDVADDQLEVSFSAPNLPVITGQGSGSGDEKKYVKSITANSLLEAEMKYVENNGLILSQDHIKIIILGKEFMDNEKLFESTIDYLSRSSKYTKSTLVIGADGTAKDLADIDPKSVKLTGEYISQLIGRVAKVEHNPYKLNLGELIISLIHNQGLEIIPIVSVKDEDIALDGVNVVDGYKSCCRLTKEETRALNWLLGVDNDTIVSFFYKDERLDYKITEMSRIVTVEKADDSLEIDIKVKTEGDINSFLIETNKDDLDTETISQMQDEINAAMVEEMVKVLNKVQDEVGRDILQISDQVRLHNQSLWMEIEDKWDDYFKSAVIKVEVDNKVRRIGILE